MSLTTFINDLVNATKQERGFPSGKTHHPQIAQQSTLQQQLRNKCTYTHVQDIHYTVGAKPKPWIFFEAQSVSFPHYLNEYHQIANPD